MDQSLQGPTGGASVDWRRLCEELADALACHYPGHVDDDELVNRVRAALAAKPEPERYCQMIVDVQALAKRWNLPASWLGKLVSEVLAEAAGIEGLKKPSIPPALPDFKARAVLARYGHQPAPPAEGEVGELVEWLRDRAESTSLAHAARRITRAADLLEQRHPAPVPVAERLPGPEDCDGEGFCWFWSPEDQCWFWERQDSTFCRNYGTEFHWLPAHALPVPQGGQ